MKYSYLKSPPLSPRINAEKRWDGKYVQKNYGSTGKDRVLDGVPITQSIYYWWFEYLTRSQKYKDACLNNGKGMKELYEDFGDIFQFKTEADGQFTKPLKFWKWWSQRGQHLFAIDPYAQSVSFVEFGEIMELKREIECGAYKLVVVPTDIRKTEIRSQFGELIKMMESSAGSEGLSIRAKYCPNNNKVTSSSLKKCLEALDLHMQGWPNRAIYAAINDLEGYRKELALEDKRKDRGFFSDWEDCVDVEHYDDVEELLGDSKAKKEESERRYNEAKAVAIRKLEWRIKGKKKLSYKERLRHEEMIEYQIKKELGEVKRRKQDEKITKYKNYLNSHVLRLIKKARKNIAGVEKGQFPFGY